MTPAAAPTPPVGGGGLAASNMLYRRPDLTEVVGRAHAERQARRWRDLLQRYHPGAASILDLGCGIGLQADHLSEHYTVTGVDSQPHLIAHARRHRPTMAWHTGCVTSIRLDDQFDVVLCVGNTLSYLHSDLALEAAFRTFAAHARPGGVLIVHTLLTPVADSTVTEGRVDHADIRAGYRERHQWDPLSHLLTTTRTWQHDEGRTEADLLRRRVISPPELTLRARLGGWDVLDVQFDPHEMAGSERDAVGCLVARWPYRDIALSPGGRGASVIGSFDHRAPSAGPGALGTAPGCTWETRNMPAISVSTARPPGGPRHDRVAWGLGRDAR